MIIYEPEATMELGSAIDKAFEIFHSTGVNVGLIFNGILLEANRHVSPKALSEIYYTVSDAGNVIEELKEENRRLEGERMRFILKAAREEREARLAKEGVEGCTIKLTVDSSDLKGLCDELLEKVKVAVPVSLPKKPTNGAIVLTSKLSLGQVLPTYSYFSVFESAAHRSLCIARRGALTPDDSSADSFPLGEARRLRDFLNSIDLDEEAINEKGGATS